MDGKDLFNTIANIDEELIESCAPEQCEKNGQKAAKKRTGLIAVVVLAAVVTVAAAVAIGVIISGKGLNLPGPKGYVEYGNYSTFLFDAGGMFSKAINAADVLIVDAANNGKGSDGIKPETGQYEYVFGQLSGEGLGYVGFWWSESIMQAVQFNRDGTMFYFLLRDKDTYSQVCKAYFEVKNGEMVLYSPEAGSGGTLLAKNFGDHITLQPEDESPMVFVKAENHIKAPAYTEDKTWNGAMDFRNIPWKLDDEGLEIVFGGSHRMCFTDAKGNRKDQDYDWNAANNTVYFDDWNDPKNKKWTGRVEDGVLVITSGETVLRLNAPEKEETFPFDMFLVKLPSSAEDDQRIMFRPDGTYIIVRLTSPMQDPYFENWNGFCIGKYEIDDKGVSPRTLVIYPPTEGSEELRHGGKNLVGALTDVKTDSQKVFIFEKDLCNINRFYFKSVDGESIVTLHGLTRW